MRRRETSRIIPRLPVFVEVVVTDNVVARGMLANVSEQGACVWIETGFDAGDALVLRLGFSGEQQPFQAAGHVVWSDVPGPKSKLRRCGLRWAHTTGPQHDRLKALIAAS